MDIERVFQSIKGSVQEESICDLHKPCSQERLCDAYSTCPVINFDKIAYDFYKSKGLHREVSVDALCKYNDVLVFIELKGGREFFKWNPDASNDEIKEQVSKYKLSLKFEESYNLCYRLIGDEFSKVRTAYFVLTDLFIDPLEKLTLDLLRLASASSNPKLLYFNELKNRVEAISCGVVVYFCQCNEFEDTLKSM